MLTWYEQTTNKQTRVRTSNDTKASINVVNACGASHEYDTNRQQTTASHHHTATGKALT